jgi:hypothetical protein
VGYDVAERQQPSGRQPLHHIGRLVEVAIPVRERIECGIQQRTPRESSTGRSRRRQPRMGHPSSMRRRWRRSTPRREGNAGPAVVHHLIRLEMHQAVVGPGSDRRFVLAAQVTSVRHRRRRPPVIYPLGLRFKPGLGNRRSRHLLKLCHQCPVRVWPVADSCDADIRPFGLWRRAGEGD